MDLSLTEEQKLLRDTFARLLEEHSSPARVRAAEEPGFDADLWRALARAGAFGMRVDRDPGGSGMGLFEATLVAEEAGRRLASGPVLETIVAARVLDRVGADASLLADVCAGVSIATIAVHSFRSSGPTLVPGGAVADVVIGLDGPDLVLARRGTPKEGRVRPNLGSSPLAVWDLSAASDRRVLASGETARVELERALEEWKLLTAAALAGLAREALAIAARYATERTQFDRPIGAFQAIAHPLADSLADVDGAKLLVQYAIYALGRQRADAAALISMAYYWAARAAGLAAARALHTHGGYGLALEYDIQLYHRRAKAWALSAGDPSDELLAAGDRLWRGERPSLPDPGAVHLDFGLGAEADAFAERMRSFFERTMDDELRSHARISWEGHHFGFAQKMAEEGLLYPSWPREWGGQALGPYARVAVQEVYGEYDWGQHATFTTDLVARTLMRFASDEVKAEVLPEIAAGRAICSLGYTEPGSGSDVAAAQTRAVREGDDWVIDGQKMFTSGANIAQYVFLLTRTDPGARKHQGLTMFLVPLDTPGIEVQAVHTLSDERTNVTYYAGVRVSDRWRVGEANGGWAVLAYALELEHGGGSSIHHRRMLAGAVAWAQKARRGAGVAMDDPRVRERLARVATHMEVTHVLGRRALWVGAEAIACPEAGPIGKLFGTEKHVEDSRDLMDLAAPESALKDHEDLSAVESAYRLSTATTVYGGTSEIMRSIIAQLGLGLPRSRS